MTADDFKEFLDFMGWSNAECARRLEVTERTISKYKLFGASKVVRLACDALKNGIR